MDRFDHGADGKVGALDGALQVALLMKSTAERSSVVKWVYWPPLRTRHSDKDDDSLIHTRVPATTAASKEVSRSASDAHTQGAASWLWCCAILIDKSTVSPLGWRERLPLESDLKQVSCG